ncbi:MULTISPECIES: FAD-binding oxidoreductase [Stutzerimonas]|jgi:FAD/FMN-containing dehydrogenase|uniref:D-2-hydroxyglutarate dehydrogenase n=2 Tax=Stutzerimonas stutzeri TaxID=316 RepID=D2HDH_STUS1|nr:MULTISPECIES: FAD-binding oxidoreductase [Stutzerimonas]A4VGK4.1 RecName: Full=D-2-hydroxyglutarate dehydrogenase; Short=D-2-HG dehydrogenase; Short=D2HGDH; AltName: Full=D-malate dehydrogenase [Stutzerimonas stutzeri A1501]EPL62912.1 oxidoreductase, FAD-binding protein [Stutzerimonas stutzeri B1SMN1]MPS56660.1 FAD-binding oxidoreductase [Pseudomonas sp.]NMY63261.1 FAD-binding oxidoreductase [Pseudomonas sp. WS 5018]ABP78105.1 oxidoreductase, FAD-binding, putative [Stutzerimonas stutzeri A1
MTDPALIDELKTLVEPGKVLTDADSLNAYGKDWTKHFAPAPSAIVFPKSIEQVQAIVRWANAHKVALVPSGGRTGLSAAAVAANGEVVVSFDYMNQILEFNEMDRTAVCQPGVVTAQLQQFAEDKGLYYPVDFASAGSSQIGGNIGTNAGGIKVIRYGMTRNWVAGMKVVTGKGDLLELNKDLIKNATGYDLRQLFIGAEGTLGFVVEATMRLERQPTNLTALVLGTPDFDSIMPVLHAFQDKLDLTAFEFFSDKALAKVLGRGDVPAPFETDCPFYALLEFEATTEERAEQALATFEHCVEQGWVLDGVMSQSEQQLQNLWKLREYISETISHWTPYKNDISVTVGKVPAFLKEIDAIVGEHYPDFEIVWFGHIGDGNLHLNILKPDAMDKDEFFGKCATVNKWVFETVQKYNGSISAEHGVGMTKRDYLEYSRSPAEIEYMKAVKAVFDPNGIMNPGKIFAA